MVGSTHYNHVVLIGRMHVDLILCRLEWKLLASQTCVKQVRVSLMEESSPDERTGTGHDGVPCLS